MQSHVKGLMQPLTLALTAAGAHVQPAASLSKAARASPRWSHSRAPDSSVPLLQVDCAARAMPRQQVAQLPA